MRYILCLLLVSTLLFSDQKQIVFGCYLNKSNAQKEVLKLKSIMTNDESLSKISLKNNLVVKMKDIDGYNVVTLSHFDHYPQLFLTIDILKKYYKNMYALDYPLKADMLNLPKKVIEDKIVVKKVEVVEEPKKDIDEKIDDILKNLDVKEVQKPIEEKKEKVKIVDDVEPTPMFDEIPLLDDQQEDVRISKLDQNNNSSSLDYILYMVGFILLLIMIVLGILFFKFKKSEQDDCPNT